METNKIQVVLYTIPQAACDSNKINWKDAAKFTQKKLIEAFGEQIKFEHIEFMSQEWFDDSRAQSLLEGLEVNFPFVLVNGEIASRDNKINIPHIKNIIKTKLQT